MDYIQIPVPLFESEIFQKLSWGNQKFLIALYRKFHDIERFTIDLKRPEDYFQPSGVTLSKRVWDLVQSGLIEIDGYQPTVKFGKRRIFKFKTW